MCVRGWSCYDNANRLTEKPPAERSRREEGHHCQGRGIDQSQSSVRLGGGHMCVCVCLACSPTGPEALQAENNRLH